MGVFSGPEINEDGRVFAVDAANTKSYPSSGGSTWYDLSGQGKNGTISGATYNSSNGGYFIFDGSSDRVYLTSVYMFDPNSNFTCSSWVNSDVTGIDVPIVSSQNPQSIEIKFNTNDAVQIQQTFFETNIGVFSGFTASSSTWYNIVVKKSSSTYSLYVNGQYKSNFTNSTSLYGPDVIGRNGQPTNDFWDGKISQITCYNRALSASEIKQNFIALRGRYGI